MKLAINEKGHVPRGCFFDTQTKFSNPIIFSSYFHFQVGLFRIDLINSNRHLTKKTIERSSQQLIKGSWGGGKESGLCHEWDDIACGCTIPMHYPNGYMSRDIVDMGVFIMSTNPTAPKRDFSNIAHLL